MGDDSVAPLPPSFFIIPTNSGSTQNFSIGTARHSVGTLIFLRNRHCEGIRCIWVVKYHRVPLNAAGYVTLSCCDLTHLFGCDLFD